MYLALLSLSFEQTVASSKRTHTVLDQINSDAFHLGKRAVYEMFDMARDVAAPTDAQLEAWLKQVQPP